MNRRYPLSSKLAVAALLVVAGLVALMPWRRVLVAGAVLAGVAATVRSYRILP